VARIIPDPVKHLHAENAQGDFEFSIRSSSGTVFASCTIVRMTIAPRFPAGHALDPQIHARKSITVLFLVLAACLSTSAAVSRTQVVVVPVANMYSAPSDKAAVVSQAIYSSNVMLLVSRGEWSRIETLDDHYKGWTRSRYLRIVQTGNGYGTAARTVQVESLFANVYREPDVKKHQPVITIPFESKLEVLADGTGPSQGWLQVRLPDLKPAWIQQGDVISDLKPLTVDESIALAKRFLGLPFLWGGRSSFGFDCSGFTQMLVRARGINMPREADQQAIWKGVIAVDRKDLQPGDLLFFGSSPKNITHTAMYIGDGQFIQAATNDHPVVQISRLDDEHWTNFLVACRRVRAAAGP
jgi:gamma-D-glutamyl-L-lysine dipeptidyl-peptidase